MVNKKTSCSSSEAACTTDKDICLRGNATHDIKTRPSTMVSTKGLLVIGLVLMMVLLPSAEGGCGCGPCARRFGCMTPAWGKCCTHFFMQNGKKRSGGTDDVKESFIEYIRLKSKATNNQSQEPDISERELELIREALDDEITRDSYKEKNLLKRAYPEKDPYRIDGLEEDIKSFGRQELNEDDEDMETYKTRGKKNILWG